MCGTTAAGWWSKSPRTQRATPGPGWMPGSPVWPTGRCGRRPAPRRASGERRGHHQSGDPMRVVIADDAMLIREGTARLLEDAGVQVAGTAADAQQLLRIVATEHPDVAIVDIKMPPTFTDEGLAAAEQIRSSHPGVGVLVLSQYLETRYATRLLEHHPQALGYLLKERVSDIGALKDAIQRIAEGECVLDPTIVARLLRRPRRPGPL